jgi:hypothetical protein
MPGSAPIKRPAVFCVDVSRITCRRADRPAVRAVCNTFRVRFAGIQPALIFSGVP